MESKAKRRRAVRKRKLLRPDKEISKKNAKIRDSNSQKSPLLALPAEIRTRIWHFLFADRTIHINYRVPMTSWSPPGRVTHCICATPVHDRDVAIELKNDRSKHTTTYLQRHKDCDVARQNPMTSRLHLSILQVCREIHREAALIPFANNTFTFTSDTILHQFLSRLIKAQAGAITSLVVYDFDVEEEFRQSPRIFRDIQLLSSLRELTAFVESPPARVWPDHFLPKMTRDVFAFASTPLRDVRVVLKDRIPDGHPWDLDMPPLVAVARAQDLEETLVLSWEDAKQRRFEGTQKYQEEQLEAEKRKARRTGGRLRAIKE